MTMYPAKESRHPAIHRLVAGLAQAGVDIGRTQFIIDMYVPGIVEFIECEGVHRFAFQYHYVLHSCRERPSSPSDGRSCESKVLRTSTHSSLT